MPLLLNADLKCVTTTIGSYLDFIVWLFYGFVGELNSGPPNMLGKLSTEQLSLTLCTFKKSSLLSCVWVFCLQVSVRHVHAVPTEARKGTGFSCWGHRWFVSCHVGAGNQTQVLCKSSKYS